MSLTGTRVIYWPQVDLLPEISQSPRILSDVEAALKAKQLKAEVDDFIKVFRQFIKDDNL